MLDTESKSKISISTSIQARETFALRREIAKSFFDPAHRLIHHLQPLTLGFRVMGRTNYLQRVAYIVIHLPDHVHAATLALCPSQSALY